MSEAKPRIVFPYVEAGMGHIAPMRAIVAAFKRAYADKAVIIESNFFTETGNDNMRIFEERMCKSVVDNNRHIILGFMTTGAMNFAGARLANSASMHCLKTGVIKPSVKHMDELQADAVFSTHWSTNYIARNCKSKPGTILYCPDPIIYPIFNYPCDLATVPSRAGYERALKQYRRRYNPNNLKQVPTAIRQDAYDIDRNKEDAKRRLGLDADKFTVLLVDGGYGIGKTESICKEIVKRDLPVNLVPVCGKNKELYAEMSAWTSGRNCNFYPVGFTDKMYDYLVAADLFCGKSGANTFAEACFFGVPQIITGSSSGVEKNNAQYYADEIKTAMKISDAVKAVDKIERMLSDPEILTPYRLAAEAQRDSYGTDYTVKLIYETALAKLKK